MERETHRAGATPRGRAIAIAAAVALALCSGPANGGPDPAPAPAASAAVRGLLARGAYRDAEQAARAALAALDAEGAESSCAAADLLDLLVTTLVKAGRERGGDARRLAERALALRERLSGRADPATVPSMVGLADVLRRNGELRAAGALYREALGVCERASGADSLELADSANGLGNIMYDTGDFAGAKLQYERALAIRVRLLGRERLEVADALFNLASVARSTGELPDALRLLGSALATREKLLGPEHPAVAAVLNNQAIAHKQSGDFAGARACYERALAIWEKAYGGEHTYVAGALNNLASLAIRMGDTTSARPQLERSLAIREKALGPSHPEVAQCLNNLAMVVNAGGEHAAARALLERSLAIREKALGPAHRDVAATVANLGEVLLAEGDAAGARAAHERALAIREAALGPEHPAVADSLHALAVVVGSRGDSALACRYAERALAVWGKAFGAHHPSVAQGSLTLARSLACAGDLRAAFAAALRAEESGREHLRLTAHLLSEREALRYAEVRAGGRDLALSLALGTREPAWSAPAWEAVAASRNVVLDAGADRRRLARSGRAPEAAALVEEYVRAREELGGALVRAGSSENSERGAPALATARDRAERAERALAGSNEAFATDRAWVRPTVAAVSAALPAHGALVSFVRYRHDPAAGPPPWRPGPATGAPTGCRSEGDELAYAAFVLRSGSPEVSVVPLGPTREVDALVERWSAEAAYGTAVPGRSRAEALSAYRTAGRALRKRVWDPVRPLVRDARVALLVPDGALNLVNWATLPVGRSSYLVEELPVLHLLTAERDVLPVEPPARPGAGLLALGGAAFDSPSVLAPPADATSSPTRSAAPCFDLGDARFEPLPGAELEADQVAALWRAQAAGGVVPPDVVVLKGEAATETAFKTASRGRRVIHLATHGFFLGARCTEGGRGARGIGGLAPARTAASGASGADRPPISGLALAGANRRREAAADRGDGILVAEEIATLDLEGTEWAVLSACETGLGELHASEGVLGLRRAFRAAGVGTVIMSLWMVDDTATREWMAALYRARLVRGASTAEAVRSAAVAVLSSLRSRSLSSHPSTWGAFVATGDWR